MTTNTALDLTLLKVLDESVPGITTAILFGSLARGTARPDSDLDIAIDIGRPLSMKKVVGFRNVAVHNYREIDWRVVHAIATRHLADFEAFARAVSTQQQRTTPGNIA